MSGRQKYEQRFIGVCVTFTHEVSIYEQCKEASTRDAEFDGTGNTFVMHKNHIKCPLTRYG